MKRNLFYLLAGACLGGVVVYFLTLPIGAEAEGALSHSEAPARIQDAPFESEAVAVRSEEAKVSSLESKPTSFTISSVSAIEGGNVAFSPAMIQSREEAVARMAKQQVSRLRYRLGLTAEQEEAFADFFALQNMQRFAPIRGNPSEQTQESFVPTRRDLADLAREVLTPEQVAAYEKIQEEEETARNEMRTTAMLGQVSPYLDLTAAQKDALYAALYNEASRFGPGMDQGDMAKVREETDRLAGAVLTPEQLKQFQELRAPSGSERMVFIGGPGH